MEPSTFIDFDEPVSNDELSWIRKVRGDIGFDIVCDQCGCAVNHYDHRCTGLCEYCDHPHRDRLCLRKELICEVCGIPYKFSIAVGDANSQTHELCQKIISYRRQCMGVAMDRASVLNNLPQDIYKLIGKYVIFGLPNEFEKCCGHHYTHTKECGHCKIARWICRNKYHCGCNKRDHIFRDDHICRQCNEVGHWSNKCANSASGNLSVYRWKQLKK